MMRTRAIRLGICCAFVLLLGTYVANDRSLFSAPDMKSALSALSDAFFVPGALLTCVGGLTWIASKGQFDAFGYVFSKFSFHSLIPGSVRSMEEKAENLYEYKLKKDKKGRKWLKYALITGLVSLGIGAAFTGIYMLL